MIRRGLIAGAVVAPALALAPMTPAAAVSSVAVSHRCGYSQVCEGYAQDVPRAGTGSDVAVSCTAYTPYTVQATIVSCYIRGNLGDIHYAPDRLTQGQVSTLAHTFNSWNLLSRTYQICVGAGYYDGTFHAPRNYVCGATV